MNLFLAFMFIVTILAFGIYFLIYSNYEKSKINTSFDNQLFEVYASNCNSVDLPSIVVLSPKGNWKIKNKESLLIAESFILGLDSKIVNKNNIFSNENFKVRK